MRSLTLIASNRTNSSRKLVHVEDIMSGQTFTFMFCRVSNSAIFDFTRPLLHQETTWYLHTRTFSLYQGLNLLYSNYDKLSGVWRQPDRNQTSLYLVHQQRSELILQSELVSVPIRSKCDHRSHADNNLQEDSMSNSIAWRIWRLQPTDLQPIYTGSACTYKGLLGDDRRTLTMSTDIFP